MSLKQYIFLICKTTVSSLFTDLFFANSLGYLIEGYAIFELVKQRFIVVLMVILLSFSLVMLRCELFEQS